MIDVGRGITVALVVNTPEEAKDKMSDCVEIASRLDSRDT